MRIVDIGVNPEAKVPLGTGRTVWMAPGGVTVGLGDTLDVRWESDGLAGHLVRTGVRWGDLLVTLPADGEARSLAFSTRSCLHLDISFIKLVLTRV